MKLMALYLRFATLLRVAVFAIAILVAPVFALPARAATITVTNAHDSGAGSLRQAISAAHNGDTIIFNSAVFRVPLTITLTSGQIEMNKSLTINGGTTGIAQPTISGNAITRTFWIRPGMTVTLTHLNLVRGRCASCAGGALWNEGTLALESVYLAHNSAGIVSFDPLTCNGGAICNNGTLTVRSSTLAANDADSQGGGIDNHGTLVVEDSAFMQNTAGYDGGGINNTGVLTVVNTSFAGNALTTLYFYNAALGGGGIFNAGGTARVIGGLFLNNGASMKAGGAVFNDHGQLQVDDSTFISNTALPGNGGAINNWGGFLSLAGSTFVSNSASNNGSAIENLSSTAIAIVSNSAFSNNVNVNTHGGLNWGGAIDNWTGILTVTQSSFAGNSAMWGGAISNLHSLSVVSSTFMGNSAQTNGGAIWDDNGTTLDVADSTFVDNSAHTAGGGIYGWEGAILNVTNSTLVSNSTDYMGGGIFSGGILHLLNATLVSNSAPTGGGLASYAAASTTVATVTNSLLARSPSGGNCSGVISDGGHNLDDGNTCGWSALGSLTNTNPLVGLPGNDGGPVMTVSLLPGSPAIDAGDDVTCPSADARGVPRPFGAHCDIGAFEATFTVQWSYLPFILR